MTLVKAEELNKTHMPNIISKITIFCLIALLERFLGISLKHYIEEGPEGRIDICLDFI